MPPPTRPTEEYSVGFQMWCRWAEMEVDAMHRRDEKSVMKPKWTMMTAPGVRWGWDYRWHTVVLMDAQTRLPLLDDNGLPQG